MLMLCAMYGISLNIVFFSLNFLIGCKCITSQWLVGQNQKCWISEFGCRKSEMLSQCHSWTIERITPRWCMETRRRRYQNIERWACKMLSWLWFDWKTKVNYISKHFAKFVPQLQSNFIHKISFVDALLSTPNQPLRSSKLSSPNWKM